MRGHRRSWGTKIISCGIGTDCFHDVDRSNGLSIWIDTECQGTQMHGDKFLNMLKIFILATGTVFGICGICLQYFLFSSLCTVSLLVHYGSFGLCALVAVELHTGTRITRPAVSGLEHTSSYTVAEVISFRPSLKERTQHIFIINTLA